MVPAGKGFINRPAAGLLVAVIMSFPRKANRAFGEGGFP
jgi:hypothetical protein